jgi:hypothetical protein
MYDEHHMRKLNALLLVCLILWPMSCSTAKSGIDETLYYPTDTWQTSTPESQGLDSTQLAKAFDFVKKNDIPIHSLLLIRNGYLVLEAYFYPNAKGIVHDGASVTKSMTSILIGIAVDKGFIKSVNQPVLISTGQDRYEEKLIGLDGVYRFSQNSRFGIPEALKGSWTSDNEFFLTYDAFANNHLWHISFRFEEGHALVRFIENTGLLDATFSATLQ